MDIQLEPNKPGSIELSADEKALLDEMAERPVMMTR
mgnify:CR=1 FL=1